MPTAPAPRKPIPLSKAEKKPGTPQGSSRSGLPSSRSKPKKVEGAATDAQPVDITSPADASAKPAASTVVAASPPKAESKKPSSASKIDAKPERPDAKADKEGTPSFNSRRASTAVGSAKLKTAGNVVLAGNKLAKGAKDKEGKKEKEKIDLSVAALNAIAESQDKQAKEKEEGAASLPSLSSKLGDLLQEKIEAGIAELKDAKAFFRKLDKNGDGKVSKMEFRQTMRELGLMGGEFTAKDVDVLYGEIDSDNSEDVDLQELTSALKMVKKRATETAAKVKALNDEAEYWRGRAEKTREAAAVVAVAEEALTTLDAFRADPGANLSLHEKLGVMVTRRGLKAQDIISKFSDKKGDIGAGQFSKVMIDLGVEGTQEELSEIFNSLDKDGSGGLEYKELVDAIKSLNESSIKVKEAEKKLSKDVEVKRKLALEAQHEIKKQLAADQKKKEEEESAAAAAAELEKQKKEEEMEKARAKEEAKARAKMAEKQSFNERVSLRRGDTLKSSFVIAKPVESEAAPAPASDKAEE